MAASMQVGAVVFSPGEIVSLSNVEADDVISRGLGYLMVPKALNKPSGNKIARRYVRKHGVKQSSRI
jgi:hypothetical protein|tara:strand:+ start:4165 stop:4365 length:201 start_codon:yes stop_codon:yes gene_type:complete